MKKIYYLGLTVTFATLLFIGCKKKEDTPEETPTAQITLPTIFSVAIPPSLSSGILQNLELKGHYNTPQGEKGSCTTKMDGDDLYKHMRVFIHLGQKASEVVQDIMTAIATNNLSTEQTIDFTGDDGRGKSIVVVADATFEGVEYTHKLTLSDEDGSSALQVFWNTNPVSGITIISPLNMNRTDNTDNPDALYRIDYSEANPSYEKQMTVSITGITKTDKFSLDNLKMFVGKNGDIIDLYGNSNHPDITLIDSTYTGGRNWGFVAHGDLVNDIATAIVALPPSATASGANVLTDFSIYKVLETELNNVGVSDSALIECVLADAVSPGYFVQDSGFVASGVNTPSNAGFTASFLDLSSLTPFDPLAVKNLVIEFQ